MSNRRVTLTIIGSVQGVGYRYSSQKQAQKLRLTGYVSNLPDGSVELVAEGLTTDLKKLVAWCYNGVVPARVDTIKENWSEPTGEFSEFMIKS